MGNLLVVELRPDEVGSDELRGVKGVVKLGVAINR